MSRFPRARATSRKFLLPPLLHLLVSFCWCWLFVLFLGVVCWCRLSLLFVVVAVVALDASLTHVSGYTRKVLTTGLD